MNIETKGTLSPLAALGSVQLRAINPDKLAAFYRENIGLQNLEPQEGVLRLGAGGRELLRLAQAETGMDRFEGLYHFCLKVEDRLELARLLRRLLDAGLKLQGLVDHHTSEAIYLQDPEGNGIELNWDREPELWPEFIREVASRGNAELDVKKLMDLLDQHGPGDGSVPDDTRLSHVHLHVNSLEEGMEFYHKGLGLDVVGKLGKFAVFCSVGGYHHHVAFNLWNRQLNVRKAQEQPGIEWFSWILPNAEEAQTLAQRLDTTWSPGQVYADPVGTGVRIQV